MTILLIDDCPSWLFPGQRAKRMNNTFIFRVSIFHLETWPLTIFTMTFCRFPWFTPCQRLSTTIRHLNDGPCFQNNGKKQNTIFAFNFSLSVHQASSTSMLEYMRLSDFFKLKTLSNARPWAVQKTKIQTRQKTLRRNALLKKFPRKHS